MTKSKGVGRGGRRKSSGRPRFAKTGKTSYFSTRLTQQTRDLLEAEAKRSGKTLSVTAERLLRRALEEAAERRRPDSVRALFFVMERLLSRIQGSPLDRSWRSSPYLHAAFRAAVIGLLDVLRPAGEIVAPPSEKFRWVGQNAEFAREVFGDEYTDRYPESPEKYGLQRLRLLLEDMALHDARKGPFKLKGPDGEFEVPLGDDEDPREIYGLGHAMVALGLPIDRGEK
jgi:hypothetical protein